jgi:hypothetical protein
MSNLGLPGFWTHAALYIGTADERRAFFDDPDVQKWVRSLKENGGDFESLLRADIHPPIESIAPQEETTCPASWRQSPKVFRSPPRTLGSRRFPLQCSARGSPRGKGGNNPRAFHYSAALRFQLRFPNRFLLVCSELIYKVYEPAPECAARLSRRKSWAEGFPAQRHGRQFSNHYGTSAQQTDLVVFLDGLEKSSSAREADVRIPSQLAAAQWHVLTQKSPAGPVEAKTESSFPEIMP